MHIGWGKLVITPKTSYSLSIQYMFIILLISILHKCWNSLPGSPAVSAHIISVLCFSRSAFVVIPQTFERSETLLEFDFRVIYCRLESAAPVCTRAFPATCSQQRTKRLLWVETLLIFLSFCSQLNALCPVIWTPAFQPGFSYFAYSILWGALCEADKAWALKELH